MAKIDDTIDVLRINTIEEAHELYSDLLNTATDLNCKIPDELLVETDSVEELRSVCTKVHETILAFRRAAAEDGAAAGKKKVNPAAKKSVAKGGEPVVGDPTTAKAAKPAGKKSRAPKETKPEVPASTSNEESTMAKTAKKVPAKKAAKAPVKKTAAKNTKKATAKKATPAKTRSSFADNAKIKVLAGENPCRAGTGRFDRVAKIFKFDGKPVADFIKAGGKAASLNYSVGAGWIKIV